MELKVIDVIKKIEQWLPGKYAMPDDRIGLQTGHPLTLVSNVLVTLDVNEDVVEEAILHQANFIFAHHNPFFEPLQKYTSDMPRGRLLEKLIKNNIALYVAHTNLDAAFGGVNDVLADLMMLENVQPLTVNWKDRYVKFAVMVPHKFKENVRVALAESGAGHLGNYSNVSFHIDGTGYFMPGQGTEPFSGKINELSKVSEVKIETIVSLEKLDAVIKAVTDAHPYEEVAFDILPLYNESKKNGLGRIGHLSSPIRFEELIINTQNYLGIDQLIYCGDMNRLVYKVAVCGGSGMSLYKEALQKGADVFVTGDIKYHDAQEAMSMGLALIDAGHYATEKPVLEKMTSFLLLHFKEYVSVLRSSINTNPFISYRR